MVFAEYTLVTGLVVLTAGLALYALGVPLVQAYYLTNKDINSYLAIKDVFETVNKSQITTE